MALLTLFYGCETWIVTTKSYKGRINLEPCLATLHHLLRQFGLNDPPENEWSANNSGKGKLREPNLAPSFPRHNRPCSVVDRDARHTCQVLGDNFAEL
jgi:hypothetical protein